MNRTRRQPSGGTALLACAAALFSVLLTGCAETEQTVSMVKEDGIWKLVE